MKAATIATKYHHLAKVADQLINFRPVVLDAMESLLMSGHVRPNQQTGHGRYTSTRELGTEIQQACDACGIDLVKFNDAPRGGKLGDIWYLAGQWVMTTTSLGEPCVHAVGESYNTCGITDRWMNKVAKDYIYSQANA